MTATFDWNRINSGEALQELVGCLLLQEVSKHARIFGKEGRDYGIDAAFEGSHDGVDGKWRYQSKRYEDLSDLKSTLKGAKGKKGEVPLILERLDAGPQDRGGRLWHGCTHYRLITNVDMSPQELEDVKDIFAPLTARGINIDVWYGARLQKLCEGQPLVMQQFFGSDRPAFIPLAEFVRLQELRPGADRLRTLPWVGREDAMKAFKDFISSSNRVLLVPGAGGVGKTRALIEFARSIDDDPAYDVRFLQNESEAVEPHLASLRPGRQVVLFVDDPEAVPSDQLRRVLALTAQGVPLGGMPKTVVAVRSAPAPAVQAAARRAVGVKRVVEAELRPLTGDLHGVVEALGVHDAGAGPLLRLAGGVPIWLSLGADALASGASLDLSLHTFRVVPEVIDRMLPQAASVSEHNADALVRVLGWALSSGRRAYEGAILLRKLVGNHVTPALVVAFQQVASASGSSVDLARPASSALRAFADGDGKLAALFVLLDAIDKSTSIKRADAIRTLVDSLAGGGITAAVGRPPPALVHLLERLQQFAAAHPGHAAVHAFVELAIKYVEARIAWHREQGEEFRIRAS